MKVKFRNIGAFGSFPAATGPRFTSLEPYAVPKYVEWIPQNSSGEDFFFYTDEKLKDGLGKKDQLGILFESRAYLDDRSKTWGWIVPHIIEHLEEYKESYRYIFTSWKDLIELGLPFAYKPFGSPRMPEHKRNYYGKDKICSMVVSKANETDGHKKKFGFANYYKDYLDFWGSGTGRPFSDEDYYLPFRDYCFTVGIDNTFVEYQMSDKLIDPMLCLTVPIYYGGKELAEEVFDKRGFFFVGEIEPSDLSFDLYYDLLPFIRENYDIANNLPTIEDYIFKHYLEELM